MASRLSAFVWQHYPVGGGELTTAAVLAEHGDPNGNNIYPSMKTLVWMTRLDERTVQRNIKRMLERGWLEIVSKGGGRSRPTEYRIPIECCPQDVLHTAARVEILKSPLETPAKRRGFDNDSGKGGRRNPGNTPAKPRQNPGTGVADTLGTSTSTSKTAAVRKRRDLSTKGAAAASQLHFPPKLSSVECDSAVRLLNGTPHPQLLLDELAGVMETKGARNPLGLLKTFVDLDEAGRFAATHAGRVEAERELAQVQAQVSAAHSEGRHT